MPERLEQLRSAVEHLEAELEGLDSVDDESRALLEEALRDIQQTLVQQNPDAPPPERSMTRLQSAAEEFEASHPSLSMAVGRIIHALGQLGI